MFRLEKVKGILFDYGGTIDSNGMHWAEVIWMAYQYCQIPVTKDVFRQAYVHGERTLGRNPIIQPYHNFRDMLKLKSQIQFEWLIEHKYIPSTSTEEPGQIAEWCYRYAQNAINNARPVLEALAIRYPLVLVSNFYGNIEAVLKDFQLDHLFNSIVESAVVGIRKPDPEIFRLGVEQLAVPAENSVVIGDSYDKDIIPAQEIKSQTIWLKNTGWEDYKGTETADVVISDFVELKNLFFG
ncbi:HAD family hydrolase [Parabacteroides sp. PF5-9]|uniref:HAD family hydrolase n=1 Tax=Parabacteroides sp. PF5-9 TaxID=1742404 RepID=UPI0024763B19|nr:HAD family hydrolase [Parabacteroides sp. PF5-9]